MAQAIPFHIGDTFEVEAIRLNDDGDGVTSVAGVTTFVPGLLPGEQTTIEITRLEKRFARGKVISDIHSPWDARIQPLCAVFDACGGCQLQHLQYERQLEHKREMVSQTLKRLGKLQDIAVQPTLGMQTPWRYRNQVQVPLRYSVADGDGGLTAGFFAAGSHDIVATEVCHLEPEPMEKTIQSVVTVLNRVLGAKADIVHHLVVRYSFTTGEQMVILCVREPSFEGRVVAAAIAELPKVVSVAYTVQPRPHGPIWGQEVQVIQGKSHLVEEMGDLQFLISPRSFFQVNTLQARTLYAQVLNDAGLTGQETVLDAYCGTGTISLMLAKYAGRVVGIESIAPAVYDARLNASHNQIPNAEFHVGEVERVLPKLLRAGERFDVVVLDPPRKGCDVSVMEALIAARPQKIVYVSCNHVTLARDLRILVDGGYGVKEVQPVDMFPQTNHVECVVSTYRKDVAR